MVPRDACLRRPGGGGDEDAPDLRPTPPALRIFDAGMGDLLRFDAERLKVLVERQMLHTGSARAKAILDDWAGSLAKFVKVMPSDYAKALADIKARTASSVAAE